MWTQALKKSLFIKNENSNDDTVWYGCCIDLDSFILIVYRSWKSVISGVQARYYLPFIFGVYLCFQTDKISNNIKKKYIK